MSMGGLHASVRGIALVTRVAPAFDHQAMTEGYLTQPAVMATLSLPRAALTLTGTLNLEGLTMRRGELTPGIFGEGYVDRRHPHTYLHEFVATWASQLAGTRLSVTAGKGFAPFGTDDPMMRPFAKYPLNHHYAQLLERLVVIGAARRGPVSVEVGALNGDEPESPRDWPNVSRFGDSWAARGTGWLGRRWEVQGSIANVRSPEVAAGSGLTHRKTSASARYERPDRAHAPYALAEWARTDEMSGSHRAYTFGTALAEGTVQLGRWTLGVRGERTTRPEELRLLDPFRTPVPQNDVSLLGRTRWETISATAQTRIGRLRAIRGSAFIETEWNHVTSIEPASQFAPAQFYGSSRIWSLSAGVRLEAGTTHARMGRYGVAATAMPMAGMSRADHTR
jgi:hypothetical protein